MTTSLPKVNTKFQPILLQGHERSITTVKYNLDGDLLFTAAKDQRPTVWYAETGERLGTFNNHKGAVLDLDPSWDSKYLLTACADGQARLFEATTGKYLVKMPHNGAVRAVAWGDGTKQFATASDPFKSPEVGFISIFDFPDENVLNEVPVASGREEAVALHVPRFEIPVDDNNKATCIAWTYADEFIIAGFDSGMLIRYDARTGKEVQRKRGVHTDRINRITFNKDKTLFITASKDHDAKLVDPYTFDVIRTYHTDRPVNGAVISPTKPHVIIGGGQEAMSVTTTKTAQGKFESRFFHMVYGEEFGRVKGHFGPINAIAIHPAGLSYASGSEDGYIRLHHFDKNYLTMSDYLPDEVKQPLTAVTNAAIE